MAAKGFEAIAQRTVNAENAFVDILMAQAAISRDDAIKAMNVMRKLKVAKMDYVNGRIDVKHGAYLDPEAIHKAIEIANEA